MHRIVGLDSIRFVCACVVLIKHIGLPLPGFMTGSNLHGFAKILNSLSTLLFNGAAAVIVFFIVSGFCIHYPNISRSKLIVIPFYIRRFIRIGIPAAVAIAIYVAIGVPPRAPNYGLFWSIICELIYYTLYPFLYLLNRRYNWKALIAVSYLLLLVLVILSSDALARSPEFFALGSWTFVVGLPSWLLGCWLAEHYQRFPLLPAKQLWAVRFAIYSLSVILLGLSVLSPRWAGFVLTLNLFAPVACVWLGLEIVYYRHSKPVVALEWAGLWSYSLYIIHPLIPAILIMLMGQTDYANSSKFITLLLCLVSSYMFFRLVENPAHKLAVFINKIYLKKAEKVTPATH